MPKSGGAKVNLAKCAQYGLAIDGESAFCFGGTPWDALPLPLTRVPLDGSSPSTVAPPDLTIGKQLAGASAGRLYTYASASWIFAIEELSGHTDAIVSAPTLTFLAIDGDLLYWGSTVNPSSDNPTTTIEVTSIGNGTTELATVSGFATRLAKNASSLFIVGYHYEFQPNKIVEDIQRAPLAGGSPVLVVSDLKTDAFAVDDSTLFAVTLSDGPRAFPLDGGPSSPTNIPTSDDVAWIALDEGFVYWLTANGDGGSSLYRACR